MSSPLNVTRRAKNPLQVETDVPEDVEPPNDPVNTDPNTSWGTEPNFNLNFNLSSPSNPRPTAENSNMHSGSKKEDKTKGVAVTLDFSSSSVPGEKHKSKIPTISSSTMPQSTVKGGQLLKSLNIRHPSTPKIQTHGSSAPSPKPENVRPEIPKAEAAKPQMAAIPRSANNLATQSNRKNEGGTEIHLETPSTTLHVPKSPKVHNQKGEKSSISPQLTSRTPKLVARIIKKRDPVKLTASSNQNPEDDSRAPGGLETRGTSQKEKTESALLRTKPSQVTSLIPKPSTVRKTSNGGTPVSERDIHRKDVKAASGPKNAVRSSSRSKDSLDSKASSKSRSPTGSREALDSQSSSISKSSLDSRDSLDSKQPQNSEASPDAKLRVDPRDTHDPKTTTETRIKRIHQGLQKAADSRTVPGSKNYQDLKPLQNSTASFNPKIKTNTGCDSTPSTDKSTSPTVLQASAFNMDLLGSVSLSPISSGSIKTAGSAVELSLIPKSQSDVSRIGQVRSASKSTLADLSSPASASQSSGSSTGKSFASSLTGSNKENQKSPSSSPGILAPLASSSPKTRPVVTSKMLRGSPDTADASTAMKTDPSASSQNTSLIRGLTFDSIPKACKNADKERLTTTESKVNTPGGLEVSQETRKDRDRGQSGDNEGKLVLLSKEGHPGDTTVISSPRATSAKEQKQKVQVHGKKNELNSSSPIHPISSSSTDTPTKKKVRETAAKKVLVARLHKRPGEQKEVAVQVEVEVVERSTSTSPSLQWGPSTSSLIGSPSCQSALSRMPLLKHVCQIEIELCSQTPLPYVVPDKASSLPACLRSYSFQQNLGLPSEFRHNLNPDVSAESIWEDETEDDEKQQPDKSKENGLKEQTEKPPEVLWDKEGMTWEVYGAAVDLESLGMAIQSHLEMKIREQERHIRILRKSVCSTSSFARYKLKRRRRRFLGCCVKSSNVVD